MGVVALLVGLYAGCGPSQAQNMVGGTASSSAPISATSPAPDLAHYRQALQVALKNLQDAGNRPGIKSNQSGAIDDPMAVSDVHRTMQRALGLVRSAPTSMQNDKAYKDAEAALALDLRTVEGLNEGSPMAAPVQDAIHVVDGLTARVTSLEASHKP